MKLYDFRTLHSSLTQGVYNKFSTVFHGVFHLTLRYIRCQNTRHSERHEQVLEPQESWNIELTSLSQDKNKLQKFDKQKTDRLTEFSSSSSAQENKGITTMN